MVGRRCAGPTLRQSTQCMSFSIHDRLRTQQRHDDGLKAAAAADVGSVGVDQRLRVAQQLVATEEEAEGVPDDRLPHTLGFREPVDHVERVGYVAVERCVARAVEATGRDQ